MEEEFHSLYNQFGREVWVVAYARGLNAESANDVLQETFLRLWREMLRGETIRQPRAWLQRVGRNLAEDFSRSSFHKNGTVQPGVFDSFNGKSPLPEEEVAKKELHQTVRQGLKEIGKPDRELLTMRYALDYGVGQIAEALDLAPSAVHMRLTRARQRLAEVLKEKGIVSLPD
ncbi:MAG: RNA polymerase sigma factor [Gemmataceae bacterium]|nr:RNA polymerase sigma factor [Gemmataceae bacterium]